MRRYARRPFDGEVWEARFGYRVQKKPSDQHGVMYDTLVNTMRAQIPSERRVLPTKVTEFPPATNASVWCWRMARRFPRA